MTEQYLIKQRDKQAPDQQRKLVGEERIEELEAALSAFDDLYSQKWGVWIAPFAVLLLIDGELRRMGVDLMFLPLLSKTSWMSVSIISCHRNWKLWEKIEQLNARPTPQSLSCFLSEDASGNTCYGDLEKTPYGEPLTWLSAGELASIADSEFIKGDWQNEAVWAYLKHYPSEWPIVLYWH